ncbi:sensor histidine kinase [Virgisporangium aurantiacum]|nr:nitrate- and nitrite sensing domain-containing protein [Virgisporangium aurantiacum]
MRSRGSRLRTKIVALLLSLTALWAFAAWVTLRDGLNLLWVQTYNTGIYEPSEPLLLDLQMERRLSVGYLGSVTGPKSAELDAVRVRADDEMATFRESVRGNLVGMAADDELEKRVDALVALLDELPQLRSDIDNRGVDRVAAADAYTAVVTSIFEVYDALGQLDDVEIADDIKALTELYKARELMSQEDALVTGALAAGNLTDLEYVRFTQFVGNHRLIAARAAANLSDSDRGRYDALLASTPFTQLTGLEDKLIAETRPALRLPLVSGAWRASADAALQALNDVVTTGGDQMVERATPVAIWVVLRVLLAAGLGLLTVIASIIVAITTARALLKQLERLREAARHLANERLPGVVDRLSRGETVDVATEAPPLAFGTDEIGQVGQTFNVVQETAVRVAVEQAELRRGVRDVFLNLARRTQALVHRQLTLLDEMERRHDNANQLDDLFRLDHLATRMRRNAENLIVLSGATPGRAWRRSVPMVDVIRGAVAEVEDYTRVTVLPAGDYGLAGRAVSDVIHLLAELIENALSFSPPHTEVQIRSQLVANGYVVEIEDRGLGMTSAELAAANVRIANPPEFNLSAVRLGLFVVSRLAERHGMRIQLRESPYGGTTAIVLIPRDLIDEVTPEPVAVPAAVGARAAEEAHRAEPPRNDGDVSPSPRIDTTPGPAPAEGPAPTTTPPVQRHTPTGLPVRNRQAALAEPLRTSAPGPDEAVAASAADAASSVRPPEKVRSMIASYQAGTRRARAEAPRPHDDSSDDEAQREGADGDS